MITVVESDTVRPRFSTVIMGPSGHSRAPGHTPTVQ